LLNVADLKEIADEIKKSLNIVPFDEFSRAIDRVLATVA
jgi:hypothetical protein